MASVDKEGHPSIPQGLERSVYMHFLEVSLMLLVQHSETGGGVLLFPSHDSKPLMRGEKETPKQTPKDSVLWISKNGSGNMVGRRYARTWKLTSCLVPQPRLQLGSWGVQASQGRKATGVG